MVAFVLLMLTSTMPKVDTSSELFRKFFKRGDTYNTSHFSTGNLIFYWVMNLTGHMYVNISNMNMRRDSLLNSQHRDK